jgi:hypothetical protein
MHIESYCQTKNLPGESTKEIFKNSKKGGKEPGEKYALLI